MTIEAIKIYLECLFISGFVDMYVCMYVDLPSIIVTEDEKHRQNMHMLMSADGRKA